MLLCWWCKVLTLLLYMSFILIKLPFFFRVTLWNVTMALEAWLRQTTYRLLTSFFWQHQSHLFMRWLIVFQKLLLKQLYVIIYLSISDFFFYLYKDLLLDGKMVQCIKMFGSEFNSLKPTWQERTNSWCLQTYIHKQNKIKEKKNCWVW